MIVVFVIAVPYYATLNVKQPKFRRLSAGALVALVTWVVASGVFGHYVSGFSNYQKTYGVLAGVIVFLLWLWITNLALLFGAEFDSELERSRELQSGMPAADELQLPPRDTQRIAKKEDKERAARARAEQLRRAPDERATDNTARTIDVRDDATAAARRTDGP